MNKDKLLAELYSIYKIIDALMLAAFFYLTYLFLQTSLEFTFSPEDLVEVDIETIHGLSYDFINYYGSIIVWFFYTRILEAVIRVVKVLYDIFINKETVVRL